MKPLNHTKRCHLFQDISKSVWGKIIAAHSVSIDVPEIGITADILVQLLHFSKVAQPNFDVFTKKGWNEKTYGSDLDVFVEVGGREFVWFALQAKVLKKNNRYTTLRDSSDATFQWEKLALLESATGCKGYFLLYNEKSDYVYSGKDSCKKSFNENQFGCSLVEPKEIEVLASKKVGSKFSNPSFQDIHPDKAQPWQILVCCNQRNLTSKMYSLTQILESNPLLERVGVENLDQEIFEDQSGFDRIDRIPPVSDNPINIASREFGWNPSFRIIIRTTESIKNRSSNSQ